MVSSRRTFIGQASAFTVLARTLPKMGSAVAPLPMLHSLELPPFVDKLPIPETLRPVGGKLRVTMREGRAKVHRDVGSSRFWTYGAGPVGPVIEARSHEPLEIEWANQLPEKHFLPVDYTLHGCGRELPEVRTVAHVHGAKTMTKDDGYPEDWFVPGTSKTCRYPMEQDATALWFHDHAMGLNRLNVYAGMFGMMLVRDEAEDALKLPAGKYEIPLMLYDRDFRADGTLFYPDSGIEGHPWVPEFIADAILINGKIRPYVEVEPRLYRFRVLNAANSRFFALSLSKHAPFQMIGSDQGLLAAPVKLTSLNLAPAERADLLIDFSQFAGQTIHLQNAALEVLEFRVGAGSKETAAIPATIPAALRKVPRTPESEAVVTRVITLNEIQDLVGNPMVMLLNRKHWHEPCTEKPKLNTTEIWEFANLTEDVHPMHLHLVRFQVLDRRVFEPYEYQQTKVFRYLSAAEAPAAHEMGWKDVVQCPPGMVTRIIAKFEGYPGKYLYHCHILEHESNDMMRPFEVVA